MHGSPGTRRAVVAIGVFAAVLAGACTGGGSSGESAAESLRASIDRTFADDFRFESEIEAAGQDPTTAVGVYAAPDRVWVDFGDPPSQTTIVIGDVQYMTDPCTPGPPCPEGYSSSTIPGMGARSYLVIFDQAANATDVELDGDTYTFGGPEGGGWSGTAQVEGGLITAITFDYGVGSQSFVLHDFGQANEVEAPPADQVTDVPFTASGTPITLP